jgi:ABC-type transporter MlaC component
LYGDVLTYSLWPGAYYDPFWAYGPDAFLSGIYWPGPSYSAWSNAQYDGLYDVYGAEAPTDVGARATAQQATGPTSDMTVTCSGLAPGVTGLPIDRIIAQAVQPTGNQIQALDDLEIAVERASEVVKASCPIQVPLTPLDRLDAVERRLDAMIQAVHMVRAPLERFYSTLSDAQRARLTAMAEQANGGFPAASGVAALCDTRAASFAQLPVDRIERTIQPTQQQEVAFEKLKAASASAAASLQASCPAKAPETPVERIDAVEMRLDAMVGAAKDVRPALGAFYATLSDEQKARFNIPAFSANATAL